MSSPGWRRVGFALFGCSTALTIATIALFALIGPNPALAPQDAVAAVTFPVVGLVLVARQPANRIGQLLLAIGVTTSAQVMSSEYAYYGLHAAPGAVPGPVWLLWLSGWVWVPGVVGIFLVLPLTFPSGHLPRGRWRWLGPYAAVLAGLLLVVSMFHPGHLNDSATDPVNPVGLAALGEARANAVVLAAFLAAVAGMVLCAIRLVARFRSAPPVERAQVKWFAAAVGAGAVSIVLTAVIPESSALSGAANLLAAATLAGLPAAIGVAILRYRLYDIDRIVSRTVSYAVVTGLLVAVYVGLVTAVTRLTTSGSSLAVAASTLAVAALFQPLRRRVQAGVDHRFNRARYDASHTIDAFSSRLREQVDLGSLEQDLVAVVRRTMQPGMAGLWLREQE